jgi:predicted HTH domain antitoxin
MMRVTLIDELDVLVERGIYSDQEALMEDAIRALLRSKPDLRRQLAIGLYKRGRISLSRGAEIEGVDIESFKESLREAGIPRIVPPVGDAVQDEIKWLRKLGTPDTALIEKGCEAA